MRLGFEFDLERLWYWTSPVIISSQNNTHRFRFASSFVYTEFVVMCCRCRCRCLGLGYCVPNNNNGFVVCLNVRPYEFIIIINKPAVRFGMDGRERKSWGNRLDSRSAVRIIEISRNEQANAMGICEVWPWKCWCSEGDILMCRWICCKHDNGYAMERWCVMLCKM